MGSIDCWIWRAMSSSRARRCSSASRAARSSMCPRSMRRIRSVTSRSAPTSSGFHTSGSGVSRSPPPIRSTERASISSGREMRRADSHTSPRVSPRMPKPMRSCHCARPRASATSSSRGAARTRVSGSPTSTWIERLPPIHARPSMGNVVCPLAVSSGRARSCLSAGSSRSLSAREDGVAGSRADQSRRIGVSDHGSRGGRRARSGRRGRHGTARDDGTAPGA